MHFINIVFIKSMKKFLLSLLILCITSCVKTNTNISNYTNTNDVKTKKVVFLIYGYPACGKLTIAKELEKKYNLNLMDNHFFNNIIFPYVELTTPNVIAIYPDIHKIRKIWMDNVVKYGKNDKGFIFTDVLISSPSTKNDVNNIKEFAHKLGYKFVPVKLICSDKDIKNRINSNDRKKRHKLTDYKDWKNYINNTKFMDVEQSLVIDNKNINQTIQQIDNVIG